MSKRTAGAARGDKSQKRILVADDDVSIRLAIETLLRKGGYRYSSARNGVEAKQLIARNQYDLVITDMNMEAREAGLEVVKAAVARNPNLPVLIVTGFADVDLAVRAMKAGAYDFIEKPFQIDELENTIAMALRRERGPKARVAPERFKAGDDPFDGIIGTDPAIQKVFKLIQGIHDTDVNTLLTGETGTGKELFARAIHRSSTRASGFFVPVNCGAIPESLFESELFGYVQGAFTGAFSDKKGSFEVASGGTIFLDEIGDLPLQMQVKLLRVLQEKKVKRVGAEAPQPVDVRVLAATHRDLEKEVEEGRFREDLYYRLDVIRLRIPPLRKRRRDILELAVHFIRRFNSADNREVSGLSREAQQALLDYGWPGNIRELENTIERVVILKREGIVMLDDLPAKLTRRNITGDSGDSPAKPFQLQETLQIYDDLDVALPRQADQTPVEISPQGASAPQDTLAAASTPVEASTSLPAQPAPAAPGRHFEGAGPITLRSNMSFALPDEGIDLKAFIEALEYSLIDQALERQGDNKKAAADLLRMNRTTLVERLKKRDRKLARQNK